MTGKRASSLLVMAIVVVIRHGDFGVEADFSPVLEPEALGAVSIQSPPDVSFPEAPSVAGLATCQAAGTLIDLCIDSGMSTFSSGYIPPDPHGAVGPSTLIAVTNVHVESLNKGDGSVVFGPTSLASMFSSFVPDSVFDPKIIYDVHQSRFVVVALERSVNNFSGETIASRIFVAVSKTSAPTSTSSSDWYFLQINALVDSTWADYPGLAVDEEAIYITCNMFPANSAGSFKSLVWIIAKNPLYSGGPAIVGRYDYKLLSGGGYYGTHMPAMVRSSAGIAPGVGTYLVQNGISNGSTEYLSIIRIDNPLSSPTFRQALVTLGDLEVDILAELADAPQWDPLARGKLIEVNDRRALEAVWVNNQLWMVATGTDPDGQTAALWVKLNANGVASPTLADKGFIRGEEIAPGTFTFMASLDVNSNGVAAFGFAASAGTIYSSAYAAIRDDNVDPAGTVRPSMLVKAGEAPYFIQSSGTRNRWGDYSGMALDPSNDDCFWAFNEYAGAATYTSSGGQFGSWKTAWARLCYNVQTTKPPTKPPTPLPTKLPTKPPVLPPTPPPTKPPVLPPTPPPTKPPTKAPTACKSRGQVCTSRSQCCPPLNNKACDGPRGVPKTCKSCLRRGAPCARTQQCCAGLKCKSRKCKA